MSTDLVWVSKDKRKIPLSEMTDSHLKNAYWKIINTNWRLGWAPILAEEAKRRGISLGNIRNPVLDLETLAFFDTLGS